MEKALARYKTNDSYPLELYFPMEFLQDLQFCNTLSDDIKAYGNWGVIKNVSSVSSNNIPSDRGIYMFVWTPKFFLYNDDDKISFKYVVYVGDASNENNLLDKFNKNYKNVINSEPDIHWTKDVASSRIDRLKKVMNLGCLEYWYLTMDRASVGQIMDVKNRLVRIFNPPGNEGFRKPIRAIVEHDKAVPAFEPAF
ncbi:hypothetical protein [Vibrio gazogenes]|uniref:Uncharacterized protein n=1 Tax=Vibrio gazogenes DSM 21264 = NBRC 103151 TaxID=1123492 RepID=A0A1M5FJ09_VIBGA|nr:hypothetical protein [Vibrio gazogenes]USP14455.1 hypothetical protein MKS89_03815 [Vibrio gazogenes]SHF91476.1 hypothetical protein SAMN02745781_03489 [Vibrio gazogenes DSM 21264] [Vibrio gazogenes DSM 21264 = NBRC 103151]SJN52814.1 hypothetical protein BQ6471_00086 [Vibrio gazogenes]